jgi:uncharacterized protein (TIGR00295 family)
LPSGETTGPKWGPARWPDQNECILLLKKAGCSEKVIAHVKTVERIAMAIADRIIARCMRIPDARKTASVCNVPVDLGLVRAGALLHDIGRGRTHGIDHAVEGARIADKLGLPEPIIHIIERHIGAGIEAQEAVKLGLPPRDYLPLTIEEKIVAHADNLAGKRGKLKLHDVIADLQKKGVPHIIPRMEALHRELSGLAGIDLDEMNVD